MTPDPSPSSAACAVAMVFGASTVPTRAELAGVALGSGGGVIGGDGWAA